MKTFIAGSCCIENTFHQVDPTEFQEIEFEVEVLKALNCVFPDYFCGVFAGSFVFEGDRRVSDLALIHKSFTHWFVVEVELSTHSLESHVLPQLRCFRFGEPESSCITSLCRGFPDLSRENAKTLLSLIPRSAVVITNSKNSSWDYALRAIDVQQIIISVFKDHHGKTAHEVEGSLQFTRENIGFATYLPTDNSLRLPKSCKLPLGKIQIEDLYGSIGTWIVREDDGYIWITKEKGTTLFPTGAYIQILRTYDGSISFKVSPTEYEKI